MIYGVIKSGVRQAYIANYPYKVEYDQPKMDKADHDPEVKVHYSPWCPLSPEVKIPLNHNMVVTVLEPVPSLEIHTSVMYRRCLEC